MEQLDAGHDICYVAFRRVATVYPRDVCTLRVKCRFRTNPKVAGSTEGLPEADGALSTTSSNGQGTEAEAEATAYASMSCSIDHPDVPEAYVPTLLSTFACLSIVTMLPSHRFGIPLSELRFCCFHGQIDAKTDEPQLLYEIFTGPHFFSSHRDVYMHAFDCRLVCLRL